MKCLLRIPRSSFRTALLLSGVCLLTASPAQAAVELKKDDSSKTVAVTINGRDFSTYTFADTQPKPYMWPVRGGDGTIITRPIIFAGLPLATVTSTSRFAILPSSAQNLTPPTSSTATHTPLW